MKCDPEVHGIREQLLNKNTVAAILTLCDILRPVVHFSNYLQGNHDFSQVMIRCKKLVDELHHLMERYMSNNATPDADLYLSKMSVLFEEIDERDNFARRLRAHNVCNEQQVVEELAIPLIHGLISEIE